MILSCSIAGTEISEETHTLLHTHTQQCRFRTSTNVCICDCDRPCLSTRDQSIPPPASLAYCRRNPPTALPTPTEPCQQKHPQPPQKQTKVQKRKRHGQTKSMGFAEQGTVKTNAVPAGKKKEGKFRAQVQVPNNIKNIKTIKHVES